MYKYYDIIILVEKTHKANFWRVLYLSNKVSKNVDTLWKIKTKRRN